LSLPVKASGGISKIRRRACDRLGSPFTARICRALAADFDASTEVGRRVLGWPGEAAADALSLRLCGGLHALVLSGADSGLAEAYPPNNVSDPVLARMLADAIARNEERLLRSLECPPQTNEIARSAMLLPAVLTVVRKTGLPLSVNEIGSSAGLNLLFDRFHYRYGDVGWGDKTSPVRLAPEVSGIAPPLDGTVEIIARRGSDVMPVRISKQDERLRLRSYVWADQTARLERLDAALRLADVHPFELEQADAANFVQRKLAARGSGSAFVLMHSIMWQYIPVESRAAVEHLLAGAGAEATRDAPLAWLRMEPLPLKDPHATLSLTTWPGGGTRHLAHCDYHGRWIAWLI
jgi:hypothetical protein